MDYSDFKAIRKELESFCQARDIYIEDFLEKAVLEEQMQSALSNYENEDYDISKLSDEDLFNMANKITSNPIYQEDCKLAAISSLEQIVEEKIEEEESEDEL